MSGAAVARKINKAMTKVGKKIGFTCDVYRPDNYTNPLDERNLLYERLAVAWSVDESFIKNPVDELSHYKIYISGDLAEVGDIIHCDEQGKTLILTEIEPIRTPAGILADDRFNLLRPTSTPNADTKHSLVSIATQVPCAIKIGRASSISGPNTRLTSGASNIELWTWMWGDLGDPARAQEIQINDVIEAHDNRYLVTSVSCTYKGTQVSAVSTKAGQ